MKYNAFISYSHAADGKMAPALQTALERFAKPWYKLRNLDIFRDESNLSVTPHLWSNIQGALDQSEYMIYLASPESASSKWVHKEIAYWLEHKSIDTLLIGLTDGEINWDQKGEEANSSLPSVLRDALIQEPFYIDLRLSDTQEHLTLNNPIFKKEVLKLAAQLHGKAPKDMASKEVLEHRKMVLLRNGVIVALLALLGFSVFQTMEAKKQEGLAKENELEAIDQARIAKEQEAIAIEERDNARKAKDSTVPWVILSTWTSAYEYTPMHNEVTGIRGLMRHAKSLISLEKIRFLSPVKIFTKGPHGKDYNWRSNEFGHYNPEFIEWAAKYLIPGAEDELFRVRTQKVYHKHLKTLADAYYRSYVTMQKDRKLIDSLKQAYIDYLADGGTQNFFNQEPFISYYAATTAYQDGLHSHYAAVASGFWIRREIDGTVDQFVALIEKLIKTYDPRLYEECTNLKYPWSNAIAEYIPGIWRIRDDGDYDSFARFNENGELWIYKGSDVFQHRWENVGPDHFKIDGKDVKKNYRYMLQSLPEFGENVDMYKLFPYRPKAWDDYSGKALEPLNTTSIKTNLGEFSYFGDGTWYGPNSLGDRVIYVDLGRGGGIHLYQEDSKEFVYIPPWKEDMFLTKPNEDMKKFATIYERLAIPIDGFE